MDPKSLDRIPAEARALGIVHPLSLGVGRFLKEASLVRTYASAVATVSAILRCSTIADLCSPEAARLLENRYSPFLAGEICASLWRWITSSRSRSGDAEPDDVDDDIFDDVEIDRSTPTQGQPQPSGPDPVPIAPAEIVVWAKRNGIEEHLDHPLPEWALPYSVRWEMRSVAAVPIRQILAPGFSLPKFAGSTFMRRRATAVLVDAAAKHLERFADFARSQRERLAERAARACTPKDPLVANLARTMAELHASLAPVPARPAGSFLPDRVVVVADPPSLVYDETIVHDFGGYPSSPRCQGVTFGLASWQIGAVPFRCHTCPSGQPCPHIGSALDEIRSLLADPQAPIHDQLPAVLRVPGWTRFLNYLDSGLAPVATTEPTDERLIWTVDRRASGIVIHPVIQKRAKRGTFTRGHRVGEYEWSARRDRTTSQADRAAFDVLLGNRGHGGRYVQSFNPSASEAFHVLSALAGSSNMYAGGQRAQPLSVAQARLRLYFEGHGEVFSPRLRLGPIERSAPEIAAAIVDNRYLVILDEASNRCLLAELQPEAHHLVQALARYALALPTEGLDELAQRLQRLQGSVDIEVPASVRGDRVEADSRTVVRLTPMPEEGLRVELRVRPLDGGPVFAPGEGSPDVLWVRDGKRQHTCRALEAERESAHALVRDAKIAEEWAHGPWCWNVADDSAALDILRVLRDRGEAVMVEWPDEKFRLHEVRRSELRVRITQRRDWFGVEGEADIDDGAVSLAQLLAAVRSGRRFVRLAANRFALIEDSLRAKLEKLDDVVFAGADGLDLGLLAAPALADLVEDQTQLEAVPAFRATLARLAEVEHHEPVVPETLRPVLRHYQVDGFNWLSRLAQWGLGGCLADDMGLGKTLQALTLMLTRQGLGPALVIAPTSVVSNWADEARKFAPDLTVHIYRGADRSSLLAGLGAGAVVVTSYAIAVRDCESLKTVRFATLIIDEAQSVKNATTLRFRAVRDLVADFRVALTGTPVENHLGELWAIFRLVAPGLLGPWDRFREKFALPIERDHDPRRQAALVRVVRPFLLRRTKREVAPELPARTEMNHLVELGPAERRYYEAARIEALESLAKRQGDGPADEAKRRFVVLAALTKLRLLACHPRLVVKETTVGSAKLTALGEIMGELKEEGHRALVFSQFTSFLDLVEPRLRELGFSVLRLDGSTPAETRAERVAAFQLGQADVFLISLRAGGTGLNLTAASFVVHLDPWWNPAVEDQATDRAHRIGQDKPVTVVRLVASGTVEEKVLAMHADKRQLAAGILEGAELAGRLDTDDLVDLMRAGVDMQDEEPTDGDEAS